jgi:hypothetical protein
VRSTRPEATIHQPTAPCSPLDPSRRPEEHQRQGVGDADEAPQLPVGPFPPEDELELIKAHALVDELVLRDLAVLVEFLQPFRLAERRDGAVDRFPFGDGEARLGQPRRTAHHHHRQDQQTYAVEPEADLGAVAGSLWRKGGNWGGSGQQRHFLGVRDLTYGCLGYRSPVSGASGAATARPDQPALEIATLRRPAALPLVRWLTLPAYGAGHRQGVSRVPSLRKFIGMVGLVVFVVVYALTAMVIGDMTLQQSSTLTRLAYFAVAGLVWVIPAGAIIWWMERGGKPRG